MASAAYLTSKTSLDLVEGLDLGDGDEDDLLKGIETLT